MSSHQVSVPTAGRASPSDDSADARPRRVAGLPLLLVGLSVVLVVQGLFVISYVGALHNPHPHDIPFGVVGSAGLTRAVAKQSSLATKKYTDEAAARRAIDQRRIYGALVTRPSGEAILLV